MRGESKARNCELPYSDCCTAGQYGRSDAFVWSCSECVCKICGGIGFDLVFGFRGIFGAVVLGFWVWQGKEVCDLRRCWGVLRGAVEGMEARKKLRGELVSMRKLWPHGGWCLR